MVDKYIKREVIITLIMLLGGIAIMIIMNAPAWACFAAGWFGIGWWVSVIPILLRMIAKPAGGTGLQNE